MESLNTLNHRLIPKLQMRASSFDSSLMVLVTTINFAETIEIGDPISQAKIFDAQAADELVFLDLDASKENRSSLINIVRSVAKQIFIPLTVGGGINTIDDIVVLLTNGADKISINTAAVRNPNFINESAIRFGSSTIVVSIDYKKRSDGTYSVYIDSGKENTGLDPVEWSIDCAKRGAGELMICSIERDGTGKGLDLDITKRISDAVSIPVISSGGCGLASDFAKGYLVGGAHAVASGTYFCFKDQSFMQVRAHIKNAGVPIRLFT